MVTPTYPRETSEPPLDAPCSPSSRFPRSLSPQTVSSTRLPAPRAIIAPSQIKPATTNPVKQRAPKQPAPSVPRPTPLVEPPGFGPPDPVAAQARSHPLPEPQALLSQQPPQPPVAPLLLPKDLPRRLLFGFNNFLSNITNRFQDMANSPTIGNLHEYTQPPPGHRDVTLTHHPVLRTLLRGPEPPTTLHIGLEHGRPSLELLPLEDQLPPPPGAGTGPAAPVPAPVAVPVAVATAATDPPTPTTDTVDDAAPADKDGFYLVRLTPIIDHLLNLLGLYFSPVIRKIQPALLILIGRYTEKNKAAAHAPQGLLAPIVFKSKVVLRTHALFQCNADGQWFLKDCKLLSGTFLNHIRLLKAGEELMLMPLLDGDIIQLGMDYRGGTEEVYRCVKMRCEFNKSWQRKVNQFNLEIHKKMQNLLLQPEDGADPLECAICLMKIEPCQAIFMSPCLHLWHYKCIRPIIIKLYPQFYCPNCRTMCDLETDIEDDD